MGRSTRLAADAYDGKCERDIRERLTDHGRPLLVVAVEGCMPEAMPGALAIHPTPRRVPPRSERLAWAWYSTWGLLCRLLLGFDGATFCWRRNEPALDSRPDYIRPPGKSNSDGPHDCAGRRRCIGREWGMAAGSGANLVDFLIAAVRAANVSYGVINGPDGSKIQLPVCPDQRTSSGRSGWSGSCRYCCKSPFGLTNKMI